MNLCTDCTQPIHRAERGTEDGGAWYHDYLSDANLCPGTTMIQPASSAKFDLYIVRGEQPGANGEEFAAAGITVADEICDWFEANGCTGSDPDVWVLVTPADEEPGQLYNLIAHREVADV